MPAVGDAAGLERYLEQHAGQYGLDPRAELAVAAQEGLSGAIGDSGTSFGPWQLHKGGAYPAKAPQDPQKANAWAWSAKGVSYAESRMATVARGKQGDAAIEAIVTGFERPRNPQAEIAAAETWYHGNGNLPAGVGGAPAPPPDTGSTGLPGSQGGTPSTQTVGLSFGSPVGTTEALAVRLAFGVAGVALVVVALILWSRAVSGRTVLAGAAGFLAGEQRERRERRSNEQRVAAEQNAAREHAERFAGVPPRLRPPRERSSSSSSRRR